MFHLNILNVLLILTEGGQHFRRLSLLNVRKSHFGEVKVLVGSLKWYGFYRSTFKLKSPNIPSTEAAMNLFPV